MKQPTFMTSTQFFGLLRLRTRKNAERIDARIERRSVQELAVLMCDSSGFSRKTNEYGILQFLATMTYCYDRLIPVIRKRRGIVLSHDADNLLAVFDDAVDAVAASADVHRWLRRYNSGKHESERYNVCIGIHFGKLLRLKNNVFGGTVNVAAKIGEDLAEKDEILVTKEVADRVKKRFRADYARSTPLGGRTVELYRIRY